MLTLQTLEWGYCFSYGDNNILHLDEDILTQVLGTNGAGKTSIPLILEEVMFNKNSKGTKKSAIPNRHHGKGYWISLEFTKDGDKYKINVDRKTSIKVVLTRNGEDISSHTATGSYKTIQDLLGMDFKTCSQLINQNTNTSLQFLTATDTNRKKFLIDLLHLEEYVRIFDIFKDATKDLNTETVSIKSKIDTISKWLQDNKLSDTNILPMLKLEINTEVEEKESQELSTKISNISQSNAKIIKNNEYKAMLNKIDLNSTKSIKATEKLSYDTLQSDLGKYQSDKTFATNTLTKIKGLKGVCHVCTQPIDETFVKKLVKEQEYMISHSDLQIAELTEKINEIRINNTDFARKCKIQKDWEDLYRSVEADLPAILLDANELKSRLNELQVTLQEAKTKLSETSTENQVRTKKNTRIQVILEQTEEFQTQLNQAQISLDSRTSLLSNLEVLKKAFSTNGLLAYKIEGMVKDLEDIVNEYLGELSDGKFTLEFVVTNDKLNVEITDEGETVDITELSSGELARVNTSTLLAIRKLMSSISKSKINVLFLDETISVLDEFGKEKLVEVLLKEEGLNTFVVSHQWEHPLVPKLQIIKINEISSIE